MKAPLLMTSILTVFLLLFLASCGYHSPYVYSGPEKSIYIAELKNRTNELGLDSKIYRSLARLYQKSGSLHVTKEKTGSDLVLTGEIVSISLPSLSYRSNRDVAEVRITLRVRYILKDINTGKVLVETPNEYYTESYLTSPYSAVEEKNKKQALETIIKDLSQKIYQKTLVQISNP